MRIHGPSRLASHIHALARASYLQKAKKNYKPLNYVYSIPLQLLLLRTYSIYAYINI